MPVHGVLVEAQEQVKFVAVGEDLSIADAHGQEDVPAPDDGLVGVVGAQVQPTADDYPRQNVSRRSDALSRFTADR